MTSRSFRRLFPQLNVQSIPEDEFYRQASLSQLLTAPDEQELATFRPDVKDPLELVEATPELAGMLGSSLEFVDTRWDSMEASPPPTPPPPPSPRPSQRLAPCISPFLSLQRQGASRTAVSQNRTAESGQLQGLLGYSPLAAEMETKMDASMWERRQQGSKTAGLPVPAKPNMTVNANMWEPQKQQSKNTWMVNPAVDSKTHVWERKAAKSDAAVCVRMWEPQRRPGQSAVPSAPSQPPPTKNKNTSNGTVDGNTCNQQNHGCQTSEVSDASDSGDGSVWEQLRSKNGGITSPVRPNATVDANMWEHKRIKRAAGDSTAPRREAHACDGQRHAGKTIKTDAAWERNLGDVRVHIRDLGMKVVGGAIHRDMKKERGKSAGKGARVKTRS